MAHSSPIYLDYAAATPLDTAVLTVMQPYFEQLFYNPSAQYLAAKQVRQGVEKARAEVAHWLGARPAEIIFTAGGTEANNLAIHGLMQRFPEANLIVSAIEHESVLATAEQYQHRLAPVSPEGRVDLAALEKMINAQTVLVSIMHANNEVGTVQPLHEVGKVLQEVRKQRRAEGNTLPLFFHTDACQAANYLDLHVNRSTVDMLTLNGGKVYGPKQSGALYVRAGVELRPQISGGGQEKNLRSGTENVPAIVGLAEALRIAQTQRPAETQRLSNLQKLFMELMQEKLPEARLNGSRQHRLPNNIHLTLPGADNERLLFALDEAGIQAAAGSACSANKAVSSHVLRAMGYSDSDARASLRLTMGRQTTEEMVRRTVNELQRLVTT